MFLLVRFLNSKLQLRDYTNHINSIKVLLVFKKKQRRDF